MPFGYLTSFHLQLISKKEMYMYITKKRKVHLLTFIIVLIVEIFIGIFVHDEFVRPYIGDVLVVGVIYKNYFSKAY